MSIDNDHVDEIVKGELDYDDSLSLSLALSLSCDQWVNVHKVPLVK